VLLIHELQDLAAGTSARQHVGRSSQADEVTVWQQLLQLEQQQMLAAITLQCTPRPCSAAASSAFFSSS
jgi:hypothetical protein